MKDLVLMVLETVKEIGEDQENQELINATIDTKLFGENLDSMGIVFLVTDLEMKLSNELGINITLADERAMSQKTSPFRSVKTLVAYAETLINETRA